MVTLKKIAVTTTTFGKYDRRPLDLLEKKGFEIKLNPYGRKPEKQETFEICKDSTGIIAGTETLDCELIKKLKNLKVISRCGAGIDNVDQNAARKRGIKIFNTPDAPTLAVAELTVGLILNLLRRITYMHIVLKGKKWKKSMGSLLYKKKVGIIGFGRIGGKVAGLLKPFGCEIAYADSYIEAGFAKLRRLSLRELLGWADIVSLHASGGQKILGKKEIKAMKKGAWLVNTSRGGTVDEDELYKALKEGYLSGAAIDVFEREPYAGPLNKLNNIILTPHIGSYTRESRVEMERQAVLNLLKGLEE